MVCDQVSCQLEVLGWDDFVERPKNIDGLSIYTLKLSFFDKLSLIETKEVYICKLNT